MTADRQEKLRLIMEKHIGGVYRSALERTGNHDQARDVTRRVMALLRRSSETGMAVTDDMVRRLTQDCCEEISYYSEQKAIFKDGVIAGAPDFESALGALSDEEVSRAREKVEREIALLKAEREEARRRAEREYEERHLELERRAEEIAAAQRRAEQEAAEREAALERKKAEIEALLAPLQARETQAREGYREDMPLKGNLALPSWARQQGDAPRMDEPVAAMMVRAAEPAAAAEPVQQIAAQAEAAEQEAADKESKRRPRQREEQAEDNSAEELIPGRKQRSVMLPMILLSIFALLLAGVIFCLVMVLVVRGVLPGGDSAFAMRFADWLGGFMPGLL